MDKEESVGTSVGRRGKREEGGRMFDNYSGPILCFLIGILICGL